MSVARDFRAITSVVYESNQHPSPGYSFLYSSRVVAFVHVRFFTKDHVNRQIGKYFGNDHFVTSTSRGILDLSVKHGECEKNSKSSITKVSLIRSCVKSTTDMSIIGQKAKFQEGKNSRP